MVEFLRWTWQALVVDLWDEDDPYLRNLSRVVAVVSAVMLMAPPFLICLAMFAAIMAIRW